VSDSFEIRPARADEAAAICDVVRRSIVELCVADHGSAPAILERWLGNKTPENVAVWIANPANRFRVAAAGATILGAGCVRADGEVMLNYVAPDARFRGVSRAMMAALETAARADGNVACNLDSTRTALRFYTRLGYTPRAAPSEEHGLTSFPLTKLL
jgi:GNAT superfamily N-acetyltransferase